MNLEKPNILHTRSSRAIWSRTNEKGGFPGIATPLNWSVWGEAGERGTRKAAHDLGLLDESELEPPASTDEWTWSIFYGRPSANVTTWSRFQQEGDRRQAFGDLALSSAALPHEQLHRPSDASMMRAGMIRESESEMREVRAGVEAWWRHTLFEEQAGSDWIESDSDRQRCRSLFLRAMDWFCRSNHCHIRVTILAGRTVSIIAAASESVGRPEIGNAVMVGYPEMEEFRTTVSIWDLSRGTTSLEAMLQQHGFHCAEEGEISSRSWRENPDPVVSLAKRYEALEDSQDPRLRETRAVETRLRLEQELLQALPSPEHAPLERTLSQAATFIPLRESGRAAMSIALDAMRGLARVLGNDLERRGLLDSGEDVFLLTRQELLSPPPGLRPLIEGRRALREAYAKFDLPDSWRGMPEKQPLGAEASADSTTEGILRQGDRLEGLGASAGVHEGTARIVADPTDLDDDFFQGDILVAPATDPSWAPLFLIAGAVVVDTGSNISHAAVVAREMGIPAVLGIDNASRSLRTGQRLRVDGSAGTVEVIG